MKNKVEIIAFYLPQYHPFKENDEWWGKGFTEWTNVGKAKALFKGHNQPRVPSELGYYDLRLPIVREQQAQMAKDAGVTAFCYWHYWFGNGKRLIADIFDEVLDSGKPNFPFCLGWANHSWYAKTWDKESKQKDKLLMEQTYPGLEDEKKHFSFLLKAFKDPRYVKIGNKPFFYIFDPIGLPDEYLKNFNEWAKEAGFDGLYLVANISVTDNESYFLKKGYDAVTYKRILYYNKFTSENINNAIVRKFFTLLATIKGILLHRPKFIVDYRKYYNNFVTPKEYENHVIPQIVPGWDHSPRSTSKALIYINNTPDAFYMHCKQALLSVENKKDKILLLKSWNEWGEGNYMEPDIDNGRGFIISLRKAINEFLKDHGEN